MNLSQDAYKLCTLCPRQCKARRSEGKHGICGMTSDLYVARAALHFWEEPPISGESGSGTIFFTGCPLRCVFCQNVNISQENFGKPVSVRRLAQMMLELQTQGALNINLVTALHYAPHVKEAVALAREAGLSLPIVCNTSGYELPSLVAELADTVDVWLTDYKYASAALANELSGAKNYPEVAHAALAQMLEQLRAQGGRRIDERGVMQKGIIVRHLVLPGHTDDSLAVLDRVWELGHNELDLSVMNQYTPNQRCRTRGGDLARSITNSEYETVLDHADDLGFDHLWWQQGGTVDESFIPAFDATGVDGPDLALLSADKPMKERVAPVCASFCGTCAGVR